MWTAMLGATPVNRWTWAASSAFSHGVRGTPGWPNTLNRVPLSAPTVNETAVGALRAVERAGLDPAGVLTEVPVPAMNARAGAAAADELLGQRPRPTAV